MSGERTKHRCSFPCHHTYEPARHKSVSDRTSVYPYVIRHSHRKFTNFSYKQRTAHLTRQPLPAVHYKFSHPPSGSSRISRRPYMLRLRWPLSLFSELSLPHLPADNRKRRCLYTERQQCAYRCPRPVSVPWSSMKRAAQAHHYCHHATPVPRYVLSSGTADGRHPSSCSRPSGILRACDTPPEAPCPQPCVWLHLLRHRQEANCLRRSLWRQHPVE